MPLYLYSKLRNEITGSQHFHHSGVLVSVSTSALGFVLVGFIRGGIRLKKITAADVNANVLE